MDEKDDMFKHTAALLFKSYYCVHYLRYLLDS